MIVKKEDVIMMKNINRFWTEQREGIQAAAFTTIMALVIMTVRYMAYFS